MHQHQLETVSFQAALGAADLPLAEIGDSRYVVRYASTAAELDQVLRLRYEVFNVELGEGLSSSVETGRDEDRFDAVCRHLTVVERATGAVVGTYRLQTSTLAANGHGFYSATEFDLGTLPGEVLDDAVELGRACIAREHRNTRVLFLLWRGLAAYVTHNRKRYLFGCCSLTSQDASEGVAVAEWLAANGHSHPELSVTPRPGFECRAEDGDEAIATPSIPRLFGIYLRYGAKVCGAPAVDRAFGTIDYFVLFDVATMDRSELRPFFTTGDR